MYGGKRSVKANLGIMNVALGLSSPSHPSQARSNHSAILNQRNEAFHAYGLRQEHVHAGSNRIALQLGLRDASQGHDFDMALRS